ncbi:histidinol-phosphatase [Phaeobacter inhibens]|uniref:histidinol-phosphatase n=1 Tax=Phaeobacter inhibens TaxID=221822 RepID=UPI0021A6F21F|nr:histidinol-phosphatase [Phaeobacter inhibens]UWR55816.1 histidinol-phosphatase [Phaeobacter inhibens]
MTSAAFSDLEVAHRMADAARQAILPYFRSAGLQSDNKLDEGFDPVTIADRAAEQAMRSVLAELRPEDSILGEEFGETHGQSGRTWVLDPIDGTRGFISGTPTWGVLIALGDADGPFLGIVDQPYIGERFIGTPEGASLTGPLGHSALVTRATCSLSEATLFTTFPEVGTEAERAAFQRVSAQVRLTRYGMDCYAYALLAAGQCDLVIEAGLNAYDIQAPIAVIQAAGGVVTNWQGEPAHEGGQVLAAATPELHAAALALIQQTA